MTLLSDMLFRLADSIKHGDRKTAVGVVERLVKLRLELCITESENHINNGIRAKVHIEDRDTDGGFVSMSVLPSMQVRLLKEKVYMSLGFPPEVQQWIIGNRLAADSNLLCDLVDVTDGVSLCLYLTTARAAGLSRKGFGDGSHERLMKRGIHGLNPYLEEAACKNSVSQKTARKSGRPLPEVPQSNPDVETKLLSSPSGVHHLQPCTVETLRRNTALPKVPHSIPEIETELLSSPVNRPKQVFQPKRPSSASLRTSVPVTHQLLASPNQDPKYNSSQGCDRCIEQVSSTTKVMMSSQKRNDMPPKLSTTGTGTAQNKQQINKMGPWACTKCTFAENTPSQETCSLCDMPRNYVNAS